MLLLDDGTEIHAELMPGAYPVFKAYQNEQKKELNAHVCGCIKRKNCRG